MKAERLIACGNAVGESPVWNPTTGELLWVDGPSGEIFRTDPEGLVIERHSRGSFTGAVAIADDGLICASAEGFTAISFGEGERAVALILAGNSRMRMNEGVCDRQGRLWGGSTETAEPRAPIGELHRLEGNDARCMLGGLMIQNGLAWSPDGRVMYLSDSHPAVQTVWAFDYDPDTGIPSNRRIFITGRQLGGRPDGAAVDTDGCYWTAASDSGRIVRLTPDARIDFVIEVPVSNPTNLCFGGKSMSNMFITSMKRASRPEPEAGHLFVVAVPFQGVPEAPFMTAKCSF
jgi:sugar lactone lactonase YvrE